MPSIILRITILILYSSIFLSGSSCNSKPNQSEQVSLSDKIKNHTLTWADFSGHYYLDSRLAILDSTKSPITALIRMNSMQFTSNSWSESFEFDAIISNSVAINWSSTDTAYLVDGILAYSNVKLKTINPDDLNNIIWIYDKNNTTHTNYYSKIPKYHSINTCLTGNYQNNSGSSYIFHDTNTATWNNTSFTYSLIVNSMYCEYDLIKTESDIEYIFNWDKDTLFIFKTNLIGGMLEPDSLNIIKLTEN